VRAVAVARERADDPQVVGAQQEEAHVDPGARGRHQRLAEDWDAEEVGVGDPEALLGRGGDELQGA
jgi:hypothetical protein